MQLQLMCFGIIMRQLLECGIGRLATRICVLFIQQAAEEGLLVILRPGPYCCAEWDFGGYPWWLQNDKNMVIRSDNKAFLDACSLYLKQLTDQVRDLQ